MHAKHERNTSRDNYAFPRLPSAFLYPPRDVSPPWTLGCGGEVRRCSWHTRCSPLLSPSLHVPLSLSPLGAGCSRTLSSAPLLFATLVDAAHALAQILRQPHTSFSLTLSSIATRTEEPGLILECQFARAPAGRRPVPRDCRIGTRSAAACVVLPLVRLDVH